MRRIAGVVLVLLVACGGSGGGTSPPSPPPESSPTAALVTMTGSFEVDGGAEAFNGCNDSPARLKGGYSDIGEGTAVTVYDDGGTIIATTALTDAAGAVAGGNGYCRFAFTVEVPESPFYQVEVSHRGRATVQRSEVDDVRLTLGS